ncbi:GNAT family N-acetyltransferase [uncultured Shimia sp.]|uniref:GNAT family N-acetyltransferase n=1 Tax=uncultured Shimia sp. TaxID=573152 RepID=UPI0026095B02|nr:GNAT family N-acetyltransferase [uncultured Shimia sp.]
MTATFSIPTLESERLILRAPAEKDFEAEAAFYASDASSFVGGPKRPDETWRMLCSLVGHWAFRGYGLWAVDDKKTGAYLGKVGLWCPDGWPEPEIGWSLLPEAWGNGFATEAAIAARDHAYSTLGWKTAISLIDPANAASEAVAKRLGASFETTYEHPAFGSMYIWRHPSADDLAAGGMEAYA